MSPLSKKLSKSVSIYRYKRINNKDYKMKSTLTIPTPDVGSPVAENIVLDINEISLVANISNNITVIYTQKASVGNVELYHSYNSQLGAGALANAINEQLLKTAGGSAILQMPSTGLSGGDIFITNVVFT